MAWGRVRKPDGVELGSSHGEQQIRGRVGRERPRTLYAAAKRK